MPTTTIYRPVGPRIRRELGPHLLRPDFRARRPVDATPSWGCCYVASEALYHLIGGKAKGWTPQTVRHEGAAHWFLRHRDGRILDLTDDQFATPVPYHKAKGCGFLTRQPSKRAQILIAAVERSN